MLKLICLLLAVGYWNQFLSVQSDPIKQLLLSNHDFSFSAIFLYFVETKIRSDSLAKEVLNQNSRPYQVIKMDCFRLLDCKTPCYKNTHLYQFEILKKKTCVMISNNENII